MKKNIYSWHRRLSLIIALPVVLSAGSGFFHPIMTNIRPAVAMQALPVVAVDSSQMVLPLKAALDSSHIATICRIRLIHIDTNWFYQVQRGVDDVPVYVSTRNGRRLPNGDYLYAQYLARQFLEGSVKAAPMDAGMDRAAMHDCCGAATICVINAPGSKVLNVARVDAFDEEYPEVNRLLPVYRVAFARPDGIRIYVETMQDRFALAVDIKRAAFQRVFQFIHTYQWLDFLGRGKQVVEFLLIGLAFVTTLLGIYLFFGSRSRRVPGNGYVRARRNHRYTAIVVSLFTAMFTFSGAWHALAKLQPDTRQQYFVSNRFAADSVRFDYDAVRSAVGRPIAGFDLVAMGIDRFWRVRLLSKEVAYVGLAAHRVLPDGEARYARYLAMQFGGRPEPDIVATTLVTKFDGDYNFTDKRLPVWKVSYAVNHNERYYVETSTGRLSVRVDDLSQLESYSFAFLHKHEFLAGFGKPVKDTSTMFWAAAQLLVVALGLVLYFKRRKRRPTS
jgi:hypothetical protein